MKPMPHNATFKAKYVLFLNGPLICIKPNNRCTVANTYTKHMLLWNTLKYVLHETIALFSSHFYKKNGTWV